ncbi:MAG: hypothetical protein ACRDJN_10380 [Chloroflexota bacterium]
MDLSQIIRDTPFVVVGGIATRLYMPERVTYDLDILVRSADTDRVDVELRASGTRKLGELSIGGGQWRLADGTSLDVIASAEPWVQAALENPQTGPEGLPYIALPYLVIMKLQASRAQDVADVSRMLGGADEQALREVRAAVQTYMSDATEDVESLITLGKLEFDEGQR